ncbi:MAG: 5-oxoprolinase subunit PxpB [Treponema sp.]|nr:5-oxoprolinase subunit PxpB [Treponema sp.]
MDAAKIVLASEDSLQIQFEQKICPEVNGQISAFVKEFASLTKDMPEVIEIVPTYCAASVYFDEKKCKPALLKKIALEALETTCGAEAGGVACGKTITIPVCYEGKEFAPDLERVCANARLSEEEAVRIHSSIDYLIYMMGFLPGFPYLGGMDERLETPRLETPRTKIPAGSVAIGGKQTGLYPSESPGGWNIIGRTPLKVFDLERDPIFLYKAGDKIRFEPISKSDFERFDEKKWLGEMGLGGGAAKSALKEKYECGGGIEILEAGLMTTIQDGGIIGFQKYGISQSGVMDKASFDLANALCGNEENAACLETTLLGPKIRFTSDCAFAICGAVFEGAALDGVHVEMNKRIFAKAGSVLECGRASKGLRSYIAFDGGVLAHKVFGSASTNVKSKIGGYGGRPLAAGDALALGYRNAATLRSSVSALSGNGAFGMSRASEDSLVLECVKSSQSDFFGADGLEKFSAAVYTVGAQSDRMGIRFDGPSLDCGKTDIISDAIPFGAVQITSAGLPVVMAADRQTTGGYAKIACVKKASMHKLAQALPGTKVKFRIDRRSNF